MEKLQNNIVAPVSIFYCYAVEDEWLLKKLETHLSAVRQQGIITDWHKGKIVPGNDWKSISDAHLKAASIVLALISPDFIASDYSSSFEMQQALIRQREGTSVVIPIILRPVDWQSTAFATLQCLPCDGKPVTLWESQDEAFHSIVRGIRKAIEYLQTPHELSQFNTPSNGSEKSNASPVANRYICQTDQEKKDGQGQLVTRVLPDATRQSRDKYRRLMLGRVRSYWISGLLERSLYTEARVILRFHEQSDAVENPWRLQIQEVDGPERLLPEGTSIADVYDQVEGQLLILGDPGAGKTTLLLELARELLSRAESDDVHPIPVVFNLSSWGLKRQPLVDWLLEELQSKYQVPHSFARLWVENDQLLLLLDGFDEIAASYREAFISALFTYRQEHGFVPIVTCSRSNEYLAHPRKMPLHSAIIIQSLTDQQIEQYIEDAGEPLKYVGLALKEDRELRDLVKNPLMLSILAIAYRGRTAEDLMLNASREARQQHIFTTYVQSMLQRRGRTNYTQEQVNHWLMWLARQLSLHQQTEFAIEQMQPDWLPNGWMVSLYPTMIGLLFGILIGTINGLFTGLMQGWQAGLSRFGYVTLVGWIAASFLNIVGLFADQRYRWDMTRGIKPGNSDQSMRLQIKPVGDLNWSWPGIKWVVNLYSPQLWHLETTKKQRELWRKLNSCLLLIALLAIALLAGLMGICIFIAIMLSITFFLGFANTLESDVTLLETKVRGIWHAARTGIIISLLAILVGGLLSGLLFVQFQWLSANFTGGWQGQVIFGLILPHHIGLNIVIAAINLILIWSMLTGLTFGGLTAIQYGVLRFFLYIGGCSPRRYRHFLDDAVDRLLLRKIGGRYIFIHRLLLEYFVTLQSSKMDTLESLLSLAELYHDQGLLEEALPLTQRMLVISEQMFGINSPGATASRNTLAELYCELKQYDKALALYQQSITICEQTLKSDTPGLASRLETLARFYQDQGQYVEAEFQLQRALAIYERGTNAEKIATVLTDLAEVFICIGRYKDAEQNLQRAQELQFSKELTIFIMRLIFSRQVQLYAVQGQYKEAEALLIKLFLIDKEGMSLHPYTVLNAILLAELYVDQGKYTAAESQLQIMLENEEKISRSDSATVYLILKIFVHMYKLQGRTTEVETLIQKIKVIQAQNPGLNQLKLLKMYRIRRRPQKNVLDDEIS